MDTFGKRVLAASAVVTTAVTGTVGSVTNGVSSVAIGVGQVVQAGYALHKTSSLNSTSSTDSMPIEETKMYLKSIQTVHTGVKYGLKKLRKYTGCRNARKGVCRPKAMLSPIARPLQSGVEFLESYMFERERVLKILLRRQRWVRFCHGMGIAFKVIMVAATCTSLAWTVYRLVKNYLTRKATKATLDMLEAKSEEVGRDMAARLVTLAGDDGQVRHRISFLQALGFDNELVYNVVTNAKDDDWKEIDVYAQNRDGLSDEEKAEQVNQCREHDKEALGRLRDRGRTKLDVRPANFKPWNKVVNPARIRKLTQEIGACTVGTLFCPEGVAQLCVLYATAELDDKTRKSMVDSFNNNGSINLSTEERLSVSRGTISLAQTILQVSREEEGEEKQKIFKKVIDEIKTAAGEVDTGNATSSNTSSLGAKVTRIFGSNSIIATVVNTCMFIASLIYGIFGIKQMRPVKKGFQSVLRM